jgi:chorismate synthase
MRANKIDSFYGFTTFGESHGKAIGVVIEDIKPGIEFPEADIQTLLNTRKPGKGEFSTSRKEADKLQVLSGVFEGKTTGMPICLLVENTNANPEDYEHLREVFRPGHADYSLFKKFKIYDHRGGGRASGRETISRVAASGMVSEILGDISIRVFPIQIGKFKVNESNLDLDLNLKLNPNNKLTRYLEEIKEAGDSVGGIVEVVIDNIPAGLGDPVFEKLDANLAKAILSIGSVKGIEFGDGFALAAMNGSDSNDQNSETGFLSNHSGGILGGISTGQIIKFRFVVKPTSSINIPQKTVDSNNQEKTIQVGGRHDTCIVPRILPVAKAMTKLVLADALSYQKLVSYEKQTLTSLREAIDKIDEDLLIGLHRRNEISKLIGQYKNENKLEIENKEREKELMQNLKSKAKVWNISEDFTESLWELIISESKKQQ